MARPGWILLGALLGTACGGEASGAPGAGSGNQGGASAEVDDGAAAAAGAGGAGACWVLKGYDPEGCGACVLTMAGLCETSALCAPATLPSCEEFMGAYGLDEGCGYLRVRMDGDTTHTVSIYDQQTRALVYHHDDGGCSMGCMPELTVGEPPDCDAWTTLCQGAGGA
ncbi:MAG TPA: hypothetical protein PLU22_19445 [Polyangiaceae bacterium]|nr:hypothetical protein [Polyangiaceae bacterium]